MIQEDEVIAAVRRLREVGLWRYLSDLYAGSDSAAIFETLDALSRRLYWQEKDLDGSVRILEAGIHYSLLKASGCSDEDRNALKSWTKIFAYNTGSFCWPGWDEPGIAPSGLHIAAGREAAVLNLELAIDLKKPPIAMARAFWLVGAYALADGSYGKATEAFGKSALHACEADNEAEALLALGYAEIVAELGGGSHREREPIPSWLRAKLLARDGGPELVEQLDRAKRVFEKSA